MSHEAPVAHEWNTLVVPADATPIVLAASGVIDRAGLLARARSLAAELPRGPAALNLCGLREHYLVALLALEMNGQACLMPPSRAPAVLDEIETGHPGSFRIDDEQVARHDAARATDGAPLVLDPQRVAAIGYTSGSTGPPTANAKTWASFAGPAIANASVLRAAIPCLPGERPWIVATVPSQHMYGMECTVMLPLFGGMALHGSHPLYPADIAAALAAVPAPRVLVSTPVHLRVLLEAGLDLPALAAVASATAPLTRELATAIEQRYSTRVVEYFGSTETCVIASRRTALEEAWRPHPGVQLRPDHEATLVSAPWLPRPTPIQDVFELDATGHFRVVGRNADLVEVAGKRASLADLTRRLLVVPGVRDAVVMQPPVGDELKARRLVAFVVADSLTPQDIATALAGQVDPAFVPRPIVRVDRLPRNEVGKLPQDRLLGLFRQHCGTLPVKAGS